MSDESHHHHDGDGGHSHHRRQGWGYMFSRESWSMTVANFRESTLPWHKTIFVAAANYWPGEHAAVALRRSFVAAANYWRKMRGWQVCCGNTGHPGC